MYLEVEVLVPHCSAEFLVRHVLVVLARTPQLGHSLALDKPENSFPLVLPP